MEKLEIRYNLVAEDGSYLNKNDGDWTDVWYVNYDGFCFIVDSKGYPIELGKLNVVPSDWFTLDELGDVNVDSYPHFLRSLLEVVEAIHGNDSNDIFVDHSIRVFDMLWTHYSNFVDNPVEMARKLEVPVEYLDSFVESYRDLDLHWADQYESWPGMNAEMEKMG